MATKRNDIAVLGIGAFGQAIVEQLVDLRKNVIGVDINEAKLLRVSRMINTATADAADIEGLRSLGIDKFDIVIVAMTNNIEVVAALMELGVKHIIAKAKSVRHERVLKQIGVDAIVKPEVEAGVRTALIATNSNFIKYSELLQEIGDGYAIGSTVVNDLSWIGKPLKELSFSSLKVNVVSIKTGTKVSIPSGNTKINKGDLVTIIGKIPDITKAFVRLNDESSTKIINIKNLKEAAMASLKKNK